MLTNSNDGAILRLLVLISSVDGDGATVGGMATDGLSARAAAKRVSGHVTCLIATTPEGLTALLTAFLGPCIKFCSIQTVRCIINSIFLLF